MCRGVGVLVVVKDNQSPVASNTKKKINVVGVLVDVFLPLPCSLLFVFGFLSFSQKFFFE